VSQTVDNRVVQMQFDNKQFEQGVAQSMSTIDKLKAALKFDKLGDGAKNITSSFNNVSFAGLQNGILEVEARFSALDTVAFTVLQDMTRSAINAGKNIVNALAVEPVTTGFQEYETQINAIQTILSNTRSKGSTLEDVNKALDELNTYADKTIYNFTEMTRNIGTFTAAGVGLEAATSSIKGIANLAAVSGSTSQQASTAMYQLSQALATGTVKLQDWNSVVNAGMGGQVFQDALKRTASVMGTDVDALIEKYGSFRESLTKGEWLTTEVLTETLNQFANVYSEKELIAKGYTESQAKEIKAMGQNAEDAATKVKTVTQLFDTLKEAAQSGWTQSWEILVGDFMEARTLLTDISNAVGGIIDAQSDARNALLEQAFGEHLVKNKEWADTMGRLYKDAYADTVDDQQMFISASKLFGKDMEKMIYETDSYAKALKKGTISEKDNLETVLEKTGAFKEVMDKGIVDKKMLEGVYKFNNGIGGLAKNTKEAKKNQHALRDAVNETLKSGKSGNEMLDDLSNKGIGPERVFANLAGKLRNAGTSYADFGEETKKVKGYTKEEVAQLKELKKALEASNDPMVKLMREMERPTGRTNIIEGFRNILESLGQIIGAVGKAWNSVFPKLDATGVYKATERFRKFTEGLKISDRTLQGITNVFTIFFGILRGGLTVIGVAVKVFMTLAKIILRLGLHALALAGDFVSFIASIATSSKVTSAFSGVLDKLTSGFFTALDAVVTFVSHIGEFISLAKDLPGVRMLGNAIKDVGVAAASFAFNGINAFIDLIGGFISDVSKYLPTMDQVVAKFNDIAGAVANFISGFTGGSGDASKAVEKTGIGKAADTLEGHASKLKSVGDKFNKAKEIFLNAFTTFKERAEYVFSDFSFDKIVSLIKVGALVALAAALIKAFGSIRNLVGTGKKLTEQLGGVLDSLSETLKAYSLQIKADAIFTIAKAIVAIAGSLVVLSMVPTETLTQVSVNLIAILLAIALVIKVLGNIVGNANPVEEGTNAIKDGLMGLLDSLKEAMAKAIKVASFGVFATLLGVAILILSKAILDLLSIPWQKALFAAGLVVALGFALCLAGVWMSKAAKNIDTGTGVGILGIAAGVFVLAKAVGVLGSMDIDALKKGLISLAVVMIALSAAALASNGSSMLSMGVGCIFLAAAITALIPALLLFSTLPWQTFFTGLGYMLILGLVLVGLSTMAEGTIAGSAAIAVLAGALMMLTPVLLLLGVTAPIAGAGLLVLAAALGILIGAAALAGIVGPGIMILVGALAALSGTMLAIGASVALFGVGMLLAALGVQTFGAALPALATGLAEFGKILLANGPEILAAVGFIIAGLIAIIAASAVPMGAAAVAVLIGVLAALAAKFPEVLTFIGSMIVDLISNLIVFLIQGMDALSRSITQFADPLYNATLNILKAIWNLVIAFVANLVEEIPFLGKGAADALRGTKMDIEDSLPPEEGKRVGKEYADGYKEGVSEGLDGATTTTQEKTDGIENIMNGMNFDTSNMTNYLDQFGTNMDGLTDKADKTKTDVNAKLKEVGNVQNEGGTNPLDSLTGNLGKVDTGAAQGAKDKIVGVFDDLPSKLGDKGTKAASNLSKPFNNISTEGLDNFKKNVDSKLDGVSASTASKAKTIKKNLKSATNVEVDTTGTDNATKKAAKSANSQAKSFGQAGKKSADQYTNSAASGISKGAGKIKTSARRAASDAAKGFQSKRGEFRSAGSNCMAGVVEGLRSKLGAIRANAISAANTWNSTYKSHQKISSPSKVTYKYGAWTMEGLVNGMNGMIGSVKRTANTTADTFNNSLVTPLGQISSMLDTDLSLTPIITPVIDDSMVASGMNGIDNMFGARTLSVGGINTGGLSAAAANIQNANSNADVVSAIGKLRRDIGNIQGNNYNINGITYDDGSNISDAIGTLIRATVVEGRA